MNSPLDNLKQQYAAELRKVDNDEKLLKHLEHEIRVLEEAAEPAGQRQAYMHLHKVFKAAQCSSHKTTRDVVLQQQGRSNKASWVCLQLEAYPACLHPH